MKTNLTDGARACACGNVVEVQGKELGLVLQEAVDSDQMTIIVCNCDGGNIKLPRHYDGPHCHPPPVYGSCKRQMSVNVIHSAEDARQGAKRRLPWMAFDYIDGVARPKIGVARNRAVLDAVKLRPRILHALATRDLSVPLFSTQAARPFETAPMAGHG